MIRAFLDFLFPMRCLSCMEINYSHYLFCDICTSTIELIDRRGRCWKCFHEKRFGRCQWCIMKKANLFISTMSLFEHGAPICRLCSNSEMHAKIIASFFVVQFIKSRWPFPKGIYAHPSLKQAGYYLARFLNISQSSKTYQPGANILCIANYHYEIDIPVELISSRLYLLTFSTDV